MLLGTFLGTCLGVLLGFGFGRDGFRFGRNFVILGLFCNSRAVAWSLAGCSSRAITWSVAGCDSGAVSWAVAGRCSSGDVSGCVAWIVDLVTIS